MARRTITLTDLSEQRIPADLTGVRWPDGTVECRFNVSADDQLARFRSAGRRDPGPGEVLTDPSVECDRCADKCG
jgi:hypothetical protein